MNDKARQTLKKLVNKHGHDLVNQPGRVKGLLLDLCAGQMRETNLLVAVVKHGMARELLQDKGRNLPILIPRMTKRLHEDLALDKDMACWAVETWALALGFTLPGDLGSGADSNSVTDETDAGSTSSGGKQETRFKQEHEATVPVPPDKIKGWAKSILSFFGASGNQEEERRSHQSSTQPKQGKFWTEQLNKRPGTVSGRDTDGTDAGTSASGGKQTSQFKQDKKRHAQKTSVLPKQGEFWTEPYTGMEFVWVPGGTFKMGDLFGDGYADEKPVHTVELDGFWMGKYPVTQAQWTQVTGSNPSYFKGPNNPVEMVSWNDAQEFIMKLNSRSTTSRYRLPTEAQWEYAARSGGKREKYSGGNDVDKVAWYANSGGKTHPVGRKAPNGLGIYDMSGNVWEWVEDVYRVNAYFQPDRRKNPVTKSKRTGFIRRGRATHVRRGGSWLTTSNHVRTTNRGKLTAEVRRYYLGFRLLIENIE